MDPKATGPQTTPTRPLHHFQFVDALRGFAILAVVMTHCGQEVPGLPPTVTNFTDNCSYGVELFFVISAFTLFWSMQNRQNADRHPLKAFFVRRFFRIAPLFWAGVLFYSFHPAKYADKFAPNGVGPKHIVASLLLVHGWYPTTINAVVPGGWSISAEAMFYLCLPLLYRKVRSLSAALWITLVFTFLAGLMPFLRDHLLMHYFPESQRELVGLFLFWSFPSQLPAFTLGLALYFILMRIMFRGSVALGSKRQWSFLLLAIGAFILFRKTPDQVLYSLAFVMICIALATHPTRLLVNRITRHIGLVSYSIYLWHFWILYQTAPRLLDRIHFNRGHNLPQLAAVYAVVLTISLVVATISYAIIERPSQQLGKWIIQRLNWGPSSAVA